MVKPSIRWQIVFILIFIMVSTSFLLGLVVISVTKKTIVNQKIDVAIFLRNAIYHNKEKNWQMQRLVKLFSLENGVENIIIIDLTGNVIASSDPPLIGTSLHDQNLNEVITTASNSFELSQNKGTLVKETNKKLSLFPPFYFKNKTAGTMRITLSLGEMQAGINRS